MVLCFCFFFPSLKQPHFVFFLTSIDAAQDPIPDFAGFVVGAAVAAASQALAGDARATPPAILLQDRLAGLQGERSQRFST